MNVLVTGATGFVGENLVPRLNARGHSTIPLMREPAKGALVHDLRQAVPIGIPEGIDAIVHLAQSRSYRNFPADAHEMFLVNVAATHALLNAAATADIKHFCLVSSGAVYEPFVGDMHEDGAIAPCGFLGASKLASEVVARPYSKLFPLTVLRLFFPYGPGQTGRLIPELIRRVSNGIPIDIGVEDDGLRVALTYIDDVCNAIIASLEERWSGTFNVACPQTLSIADIGRQIAAAMGLELTLERTKPQQQPIIPDLTRFSSVFDINCMRTFEMSVAELVKHV